MNDGLVDNRIVKEVLEGLEEMVSRSGLNGDLKVRNGPMILKTTFINFAFYLLSLNSQTIYLSISTWLMDVSTILKWSFRIGERRDLERSIWAEKQENIEPDTTIVGEAYTSDFKTHYSQDRYYYKVVFDNADQYETFHFDVDFNNDITIGFSDTQEHSDVKIEIVIGGWTGTASVIRSGNYSPLDGHVKVYHTKSEFDVFKHNLQITIADGGVQVFTGDNEPFMEWQSSTIVKSELTNLLVAGGWGGYGTYKINAERRPKTEQEIVVCQGAADGLVSLVN